jgi:hypothetical protein
MRPKQNYRQRPAEKLNWRELSPKNPDCRPRARGDGDFVRQPVKITGRRLLMPLEAINLRNASKFIGV